jgi:hypothetical protein
MTPALEKELLSMGILPSAFNNKKDKGVDPRLVCLAKGYFDDPRDPVTGEVNH